MDRHQGTSFVEIRRHSARHHDEWGHLTQDGVELARRVGATMGTFHVVVTSPLPRAAETAIAMGYGIDREVPDLALVGKHSMAEIDWPMSFSDFAERMKPDTAMRQRGAELSALLLDIGSELGNDDSALLLSHGAVIEMAAIASTPWLDHATWGAHCGHCEGLRLTIRDGVFVAAEILRIEHATGR